jgi:hypothetical protein
MAISTVRAQVNGTWHTLTYDSASGSYKATITAPGQTSFRQTGGYYNISVEATNRAGTKGTANASTLTSLRLVVKEKVAPVITILSPASGAYVTNNKQPVIFNVVDETNGSGINLSTLVVKQDGTAVASTAVVTTAITNGYSVTYTPASAILDGSHTVTISVSDNDGNAATAKSTTYTIDTTPPTLNITAPADNLVTATASLTVSGKTNDNTSSPVTVVITLNGTNQGTVTVATDGSFSKAVTLAEGSNTLVVKATDAAGKASSITRTVTLDTSVPKVTSATISPNPVDAGATMIISVVIEG